MVWYAVRAKRGQEARVVAHLTPRGVGTLLPLLEVIRRYRTRRVTLLEPLFPGYLFVRTPPAVADPRTYDRVRWAPGVRYVLGTEEGPVPVPDEVVGAIQVRVAELGFVRPRRGYDRGARVRFLRGPLEGWRPSSTGPCPARGACACCWTCWDNRAASRSTWPTWSRPDRILAAARPRPRLADSAARPAAGEVRRARLGRSCVPVTP